MVSIMAFGQTYSGAKTLGWEENLGVVLCSTDGFQKCVLKIRWGMFIPVSEAGVFRK
jgi:hypothetical protein